MRKHRSLALLALLAAFVGEAIAQPSSKHVHDLSLTVAADLPCVWPVGMTPFALVPTRTFGPGPYHRDMLVIDEHTGTQWDAPAHFIPPPKSGLPGAGPNGLITGEKVPAWQFCGEACVIDLRKYRDKAAKGASFLIRPEHVQNWETANRPLKFGDVVLFRSDYSDDYYKPFNQGGERFVHTALNKDTAGWPAPTPETMNYLADRGVMTLGLDGVSMGPLPDLAVATHQAGGRRGMIWIEAGTNFGALPGNGAFYAMLAAKHAEGSGGECRSIAITEPKLADRLIDSARAKRVADLSVTLHEEFPVTWPGAKPGDEASRYVAKTLNAFDKARGPYFARTHLFDTQAGTHVVLPSYSLPGKGFDTARYSEEVRQTLKKFTDRFGPLGVNSTTIEQTPLVDLMGPAHVIDVRGLVGTTKPGDLPRSPVITLDFVKAHEAKTRPIRAGDVVLFRSGHSDRHFKRFPEAPELDGTFAAPLAGKAEGWPTPTPEVIAYLAEKGVRCLGTDGPTLGGVDAEHALMVNWMAASRHLPVVEFLTNLQALEERDAYFLFAPIKIRGARAGYGRALGLY
jgi:kynurenine formamidase